MRSATIRRGVLLLAAAFVVPACGGGGGGSVPNGPPSVSVATPSSPQGGNITLSYTLSDPWSEYCSIQVEYSVDAGVTFSPATPGPGGDGIDGLSSWIFGVAHTFVWDSEADGVGSAGPVAVIVRITPTDFVTGASAETGSFTVDNTAASPPSASIATPAGTSTGFVTIGYSLADAERNTCSIAAEFSIDGGGTWAAATRGPGGEGTTFLASSPAGTAHTFLWNSFADGVATAGPVATVRFRVTPSDGAAGAAATTANFTVDNSTLTSGGSLGGFPVQNNPTFNADTAHAIAVDDRYMYVAGVENFSASPADSWWRIEKRSLVTGALVAAFGNAGVVRENPGFGVDAPSKIVIDATYMYILGSTEAAPGVHFGLLQKRLLSNGAFIGNILLPSLGAGAPVALAADGTHLYIGLSEWLAAPADYRWRIEKRLKFDGNLEPAFGTGGVVTDDVATNAELLRALVINGGSLWIGGSYDGGGSDFNLRLQKRSLADGSLVTAFGTNGTIEQDLSVGDDQAFDLAHDGTSLYTYLLLETTATSSVFEWRVEKLNPTTGALIAGVTTGGTDPLAFSSGNRLAIDGANLYVAGTHGTWLDPEWRIEKRLLSDLSLVPSFGTGGVVGFNATVSDFETCLGAAVRGGVVYFPGGDSDPSERQWRIESRWR